MTKRIVIAPDSFKGSLSAVEVCNAIERGWRTIRPHDEIILAPQADGGEGTLDAISIATTNAMKHQVGLVTGPDGRPTNGEWIELPNGVGVVELAQCSGLPLMEKLDPLGATTFGLGQVIAAAMDHGTNSLYIAVGGSASTDGGAGALSALGLRLLDANGAVLPLGGGALALLEHVEISGLRRPPAGGVSILTDVDSPLLGPKGAAEIFGPQKGAGRVEITLLEAALHQYSKVLGGDPMHAGTGAAGGTAYGFATMWNAKIESGADYISKVCGLSEKMHNADLLITGEGRFDQQSLSGKVVGQLLAQAHSMKLRTAIIAGQITAESGGWQRSLIDISGSVEAALENPAHWLTITGAQVASEFYNSPDA